MPVARGAETIVRQRPPASAVYLASVLGCAGMLVHDVFEFGPAFLIDPQTLIPLAIYVALALLAARPAAGRASWIVLFAWATTNLVGGGILSVLPLGVFPFQPEQSLGHYGVHVVYAMAQGPLVVVAWSGLREPTPQVGTPSLSEPSDLR